MAMNTVFTQDELRSGISSSFGNECERVVSKGRWGAFISTKHKSFDEIPEAFILLRWKDDDGNWRDIAAQKYLFIEEYAHPGARRVWTPVFSKSTGPLLIMVRSDSDIAHEHHFILGVFRHALKSWSDSVFGKNGRFEAHLPNSSPERDL